MFLSAIDWTPASYSADYFFMIALCSVAVILTEIISQPIIKILQLSDYKSKGIYLWFKATRYDYLVRYLSLAFLSFASMFVFVACFRTVQYVRYLGILFYIIFCSIFLMIILREKQKNRLKITPRVIRLFIVNALILVALAALVAYLTWEMLPCYSLLAILGLSAPFTVVASNSILAPFEKMNNNRYIKKAAAKIKGRELIKIGITGSYGKTTTKNILASLLSTKYRVCISPQNYNTPMGITKTINYTLKDDDQVFIAEMGARFPKDIKDLCDIVHPSIGMITAIGNQHLESFKTHEGIMAAKYELIESLPQDGIAFFNADNSDCVKLFEKCDLQNKFAIGENTNQVGYSDVVVSGRGTEFTLTANGQSRKVTMKLLGRHIPILSAMCVQVALMLGCDFDKVVEALSTTEPIPHRLQLIYSEQNITIIDDAYNSNPRGAANALEVLSEFDAVKIIITPGFVELGAVSERENRALGEKIASVCDYAFVLGSRAEMIKSGALQAGMDESRIITVPSLSGAVDGLKGIEGVKAVLFENDLPDNVT